MLATMAGRVKARQMQASKRPKSRKTPLQRLANVSVGDVGTFLWDAAGVVRKLVNTEQKKFDYNFGGEAALTAAGSVICLSNIIQGDGYQNRDGRSVRANALEARIHLRLDPAVGLYEKVRLIAFIDMENAGAVPAVTDVLEYAGPLSCFKNTNLERFIPILDQVHELDTYNGESRTIVIKQAIDLHLKWRGEAGTAADLAEGHIMFLAIKYTATANRAFLDHSWRVSFVDN